MNNIWKRVFNWESVKGVLKSSFMGALIGALVTLAVFNFYQSPQLAKYDKQLDIMDKTLSIQNESLVKRVQLELEVVPRYDWKVSASSNGSMQLINTTLTLPRNEQTIFHVYVSNVGNAIAHLLYWTVTIFSTPNSLIASGPIYDIQNIVLAPYSLYNMTYTFDPSAIPAYYSDVVLNFALMSTESIVYETVNATFR